MKIHKNARLTPLRRKGTAWRVTAKQPRRLCGPAPGYVAERAVPCVATA